MAKRTVLDISALIGCALFAVVSLLMAFHGEAPWWFALLWTAGVLVLLIPRGWSAVVDEIEITELGVRRRFGPKLRKKREERISWEELSRVEIVTTDDGPWAEDFFFVLHGREGKGLVVSNRQAVLHGLVAHLQRRLSGLDNKAIIEASGSVEPRRFLVWQQQRGGEDA